MISFVIPVYYKNRNHYIYKRARYLVEIFGVQYPHIEVIIVDSSKVKKLNSAYSNVKIIPHQLKTNIYSPAIARNIGVENVSKKYIIFFDVDIDFHQNFLQLLVKEVNNVLETNKKSFLMLPCLYLSEYGTEKWINSQDKLKTLYLYRESYLKGEIEFVLRLALNTSLIVLSTSLFYKVGKFQENFYGHGGEDFEFLHRLVSYSPHSMKEEDYYSNVVEQFPAHYIGFRKYMAIYALEYFFTDLLTVHKWHERSLGNIFYMKKNKNYKLLIEMMKLHDNNPKVYNYIWQNTSKPIELALFINELQVQYGYDPLTYKGMFQFKKNVKLKSSFGAKIRKLFLQPRMFFKDFFKKRMRK